MYTSIVLAAFRSTACTATVQFIAFCLSVINAGQATRRWFETDEVIAPLLILIAQIAFLLVALAVKHFVLGVVKFFQLAHMGFEFYCQECVDAAVIVAEDAIATPSTLCDLLGQSLRPAMNYPTKRPTKNHLSRDLISK